MIAVITTNGVKQEREIHSIKETENWYKFRFRDNIGFTEVYRKCDCEIKKS